MDEWGDWEATILDNMNSQGPARAWIVEGERPLAPPSAIHLHVQRSQFGQFAVSEHSMHLIDEPNDIMKDLCTK